MKVKVKLHSVKVDNVKASLVKECEQVIAGIERKLSIAKNDIRKADSEAMVKYILASLKKALDVL